MSNTTLIDALTKAYNAEIETVANYLCNSVNLDGVRARHIKQALEADIPEELNHATLIAKRIKTIGGVVPGSQALKMTQSTLQPPKSSVDVVAIIKGVIDAEEGAIAAYQRIIELSEECKDYVTADLATTILGDEQEHRREFVGFLKEYEANA